MEAAIKYFNSFKSANSNQNCDCLKKNLIIGFTFRLGEKEK